MGGLYLEHMRYQMVDHKFLEGSDGKIGDWALVKTLCVAFHFETLFISIFSFFVENAVLSIKENHPRRNSESEILNEDLVDIFTCHQVKMYINEIEVLCLHEIYKRFCNSTAMNCNKVLYLKEIGENDDEEQQNCQHFKRMEDL